MIFWSIVIILVLAAALVAFMRYRKSIAKAEKKAHQFLNPKK